MSGKTKKIFIIALLIAAAGVFYYYAARYKKETGPSPIRTTGVVEALETDIASKIAGRLDYVGFREGAHVRKGDLRATIESADLEASLRAAEAAVKSADATLASGYDAVKSAAAQVVAAAAAVKSAGAGVSRAEAQLDKSGKDLRRAAELFGKGIVARADLDAAQAANDTNAADLDAAGAALSKARADRSAASALLKQAEGSAAALKARVSEAQRQADYQRAALSYASIYSPVDAVVEYRSLEPGEVVAPGTSILTLIDLSRLWVRIDLEQRYITRVRAGQKAGITLEGMPGRVFTGTVFDIGREGEFAVERDVTRGRQDIKTFRTRMWVDNPGGVLKPGMTVIVRIPPQ